MRVFKGLGHKFNKMVKDRQKELDFTDDQILNIWNTVQVMYEKTDKNFILHIIAIYDTIEENKSNVLNGMAIVQEPQATISVFVGDSSEIKVKSQQYVCKCENTNYHEFFPLIAEKILDYRIKQVQNTKKVVNV